MILDMPDEIVAKLRSLCIDDKHPAWLCVSADARLQESGGDLAHYGMATLDPAEPVVDQVDCLAGLLPLEGDPFLLPYVQIQQDRYVDLHIFRGAKGDWVLLLDVTGSAHRLFELQQNTNELSLLRREQTKMIAQIRRSNSDLVSILNQLEVISAILDAQGRIEFLSDSGARFLGVTPEKASGNKWETVMPFQETDKAHVRDMMRVPVAERTRVQVRARAGGRQFTLDVDVRDDPRESDKRIMYMYDVSEVYDLRQMLQERAVFHDIIGDSKSIRHVFQLIRDIAQVDATVLIEGETGTGKELVARAIHYSGHRSEKPFIVVNSAGLSDSLINSQLFGHKKGAFTDAVSDQKGFFEAAEGGTILLDEIGDIPLNTQTRILRTLEQKEVVRIGETEPRAVDVRILAATNKDLNQEVEKGNFRLDLLYRLRIARVKLPALRERAEDIPLLVQSFLAQTRASTGKGPEDIDHDAMRVLLEYSWPGNVRELRNAISFAAIHCKGNIVRPRDLPPELLSAPSPRPTNRDYSVESEKTRILDALERAGGRRGEAAKLLGIGRATLYRRMKACMINPADLPRGGDWESHDS